MSNLHSSPSMEPLTQYNVRQAGYGRVSDVIGQVYTSTPFVQRGHGIGSFLSGIFRTIRPFLLSGAKTVGRESLRAGDKILSEIADSAGVAVKDIVSKT